MDEAMRFSAEKVLKRETDKFLKEIDCFMAEGDVAKILAGQKKGENGEELKVPGRKQFKMLMDAAGEAACIEELLLFISYQKSKKNGWEIICSDGKEDIAKKLAASFMRVQDEIYRIIEQENWAGEIKEDDERLLRLMIAEKYLGYLYWKASVVSKY